VDIVIDLLRDMLQRSNGMAVLVGANVDDQAVLSTIGGKCSLEVVRLERRRELAHLGRRAQYERGCG
jgi:hypothetical protein